VTSIHSLIISALGEGHSSLLIADENCKELPFGSLPKATKVLTNRVDIAHLAISVGLDTSFSDFDFSPYAESPPSHVVYHLSKEKPVVHHIANEVANLIMPNGAFSLLGTKQQGIKTFAKTIGRRLGGTTAINKNGSNYLVSLTRGEDRGPRLDDSHYPKLRPIFDFDQKPVFSKPGTFGWDKIDQGSRLLADYLNPFLQQVDGTSLLDLGCGYGYLSMHANLIGRNAGKAYEIIATDNCAAALLACEKNFSEHKISGQVIASDGGAELEGQFDAILCNPPFHQGFQTDSGLTETFLKGTRQLLRKKGKALFVVNQFVPLEALAKPLFSTVTTVARDQSFKLVSLR